MFDLKTAWSGLEPAGVPRGVTNIAKSCGLRTATGITEASFQLEAYSRALEARCGGKVTVVNKYILHFDPMREGNGGKLIRAEDVSAVVDQYIEMYIKKGN